MNQANSFEARHFRDVLGHYPTGVIVVTTLGPQGQPVGLTVNSFSSVSLDPPLVLWSLALKAPSLEAFRTSDGFALNILSEDQLQLCRNFATPSPDKFASVEYRPGLAGMPLLTGAVAHIECRTAARYPGGDHEIYLGAVDAIEEFGHKPLLFHQGQFHQLAPADANLEPASAGRVVGMRSVAVSEASQSDDSLKTVRKSA